MAKKKPSLDLLGDKILVKPTEEKKEQELASGILIPETSNKKEDLAEGTVVAVGPGKKNKSGEVIKMDIKKGDEVLFNKDFSAKEFKFGGDKYLIISEDSVFAIVK